MRTYLIAQETLFNALWWSKWEGNPKKRVYVEMCICRDDSLCCSVETKETIFQFKKKKRRKYRLEDYSTK